MSRPRLLAFAARSRGRAAATAACGGFERGIVPVGGRPVDRSARPARALSVKGQPDHLALGGGLSSRKPPDWCCHNFA